MENGKEYDMPSGAKLYVSVAEWGKVKALHDALARAMIGSGVSAPEVAALMSTLQKKFSLPGAQPQAVGGAEPLIVMATLTRKALEMASSKELEAAIFACAEAAVYRVDGTPESSVQFKVGALGYGVFDNARCRDGARGDYYEICQAIVETNLLPFAKALRSMFAAHVGRSADSQPSNTAQESTKQQ